MSQGHKLGSKIGGIVLPNIGNKIWIGDDDHMEEADTRIKYSVLLEEKLKAAQRNAAKLRAVSRMVMVNNKTKAARDQIIHKKHFDYMREAEKPDKDLDSISVEEEQVDVKLQHISSPHRDHSLSVRLEHRLRTPITEDTWLERDIWKPALAFLSADGKVFEDKGNKYYVDKFTGHRVYCRTTKHQRRPLYSSVSKSLPELGGALRLEQSTNHDTETTSSNKQRRNKGSSPLGQKFRSLAHGRGASGRYSRLSLEPTRTTLLPDDRVDEIMSRLGV